MSNIDNVLKALNPYGGFIGINQKGAICHGNDGPLPEAEADPEDWMDEDEVEEWRSRLLPKEDRLALADEMIGRWQKYKDSLTR